MSEGATRAVIGIAALGLGFVVGFLVTRPGPPGPRLIGSRHVVVVGPRAVNVYPQRTDLGPGDEIFWVTTGPGPDLVIESEERLFEHQSQQGNGRWAMTCTERTCESNAILAETKNGRYKYWQLFRRNGQTIEEADGWIIIDR